MEKYRVQMRDKDTGKVEDDCIDEMFFDTESEANEYVCSMRSCATEEAEILKMSNPLITRGLW